MDEGFCDDHKQTGERDDRSPETDGEMNHSLKLLLLASSPTWICDLNYWPVLVRGGSRVGERRWSVDSFVVGERFTIPQRSTCFHNALVATLLKTGATAKTDLLYSWQVHGVDTGDPAD